MNELIINDRTISALLATLADVELDQAVEALAQNPPPTNATDLKHLLAQALGVTKYIQAQLEAKLDPPPEFAVKLAAYRSGMTLLSKHPTREHRGMYDICFGVRHGYIPKKRFSLQQMTGKPLSELAKPPYPPQIDELLNQALSDRLGIGNNCLLDNIAYYRQPGRYGDRLMVCNLAYSRNTIADVGKLIERLSVYQLYLVSLPDYQYSEGVMTLGIAHISNRRHRLICTPAHFKAEFRGLIAQARFRPEANCADPIDRGICFSQQLSSRSTLRSRERKTNTRSCARTTGAKHG